MILAKRNFAHFGRYFSIQDGRHEASIFNFGGIQLSLSRPFTWYQICILNDHLKKISYYTAMSSHEDEITYQPILIDIRDTRQA